MTSIYQEIYETYLEKENFELLACNRNYAEGYNKHWHRHIEYHYVTEGEYEVTIDGKKDVVREGDFLLIFPYCYHSLEETDCSQYLNIINLDVVERYNYIFLEKRLLNPIIRANQLSPNIGFFAKYVFDLIPVTSHDITCHITYVQENSTIDGLLLKQNIHSAVNCLIGEVLRCAQIIPMNKKAYMDTSIDTTSRIMQYCMQNFSKDITLEQMSKELFLNKYYISKVFSKNIGMPFNSFINHYRIDRCCELLKTTDRNIVDIMFECGFKSQGTFNSTFKNIMKITPKEYRIPQAIKPKKMSWE